MRGPGILTMLREKKWVSFIIIPVINFRRISLATQRHEVQIAGQVSRKNSRLRRYFSYFRKVILV